jgi:hypothetical protein
METHPPHHHLGSSTDRDSGNRLMPRNSTSLGSLKRKKRGALLMEKLGI